jgi:isocitrate dehydrogenase
MTTSGERIVRREGKLVVPDHPTIPFIEGDGTGPDIWRASVRVFDAAVEKAYKGRRAIGWHEVLAGEKAFKQTGSWLPADTLSAFREYLVGIKGPLTSRSGRSSTSTCACGRCATSREWRRPCGVPTWSTW